MNCDKAMPDYLKKYGDYFSFDGRVGTIVKENAPKEAIRLYLRSLADYNLNCEELGNKEALINFMVEEFKKLDIYTKKTEEERQDIIEDIKKHPAPQKFEFLDENGKPIPLKDIYICW